MMIPCEERKTMLTTLIISILSFIGLIALIFLRPSVLIKGRSINIYWLAPLIGALLLILFKQITPSEVFAGLTRDTGMNPIKILILLISMTIISIYLDNAGFFGYIACKVLAFAKASQTALFFCLYAIVSVLTIFTSNDIIVLTFTPFICYFARNAKIDPIPYLICEFVAANTWSMVFIIGNPTNIYLASNAGIGFVEYLSRMMIPTVFAGLASLFIMWLLFRKKLREPIRTSASAPKLGKKYHVFTALSHLVICIILMSISLYIDIPMWLISLCACASLIMFSLLHSLLCHENCKLLRATIVRAPWDVVPFIISMFVIVLAFEKSGICGSIAAFLSGGEPIFTFGTASFFSANIINNIPMSVLFSSICADAASIIQTRALYASIIGSNIGAFLTPIGAIAGIMWMSVLKLQRIKLSYVEFIRYGAIISIPTILAALSGLFITL